MERRNFFIYKQFPNDEELLRRIRLNEEGAINILIEKYRRFAWGLAKKFFDTLLNPQFTLEDLFSVALSTIKVALDKFDENRNYKFYSYWTSIAVNAMRHYAKHTIKESMIDNNISLDTEIDNGSTLHDVLTGENVDKNISLFNSLMNMINNPNTGLSDLEKNVISLFLDGYEFKDISKRLKISKSTTYRSYHSAINRIRHSIIEKK